MERAGRTCIVCTRYMQCTVAENIRNTHAPRMHARTHARTHVTILYDLMYWKIIH